ncbi:hypothetical protein DFH28DRAFT_1081422 [Melampsora americana]|nr:hypothetical protein DFH28DRAFT_1081422 [Melampsora americana]
MGGQNLERVVKKRRLAQKSNAIHTTPTVGNLNLSPIVSAVSAPSWMDLSSSQPTPTSTPNFVTSSANVATPTSSPTKDVSAVSADPSATDNSMTQKTSSTSTCLGAQCTTMATTSTVTSSSGSAVPVSGSSNAAGPSDFLESLGSSAGSIFVTTLVGLAILGVIFAISSWGLRRWCNRRRKKIIDDDTWKFLNTPQEFSKRALDDEVDSIKSMPHGFSGQIPHVLLHNDLPHTSAPSHLFSTHLQPPPPVMSQVSDSNSTSQFHSFVGFHQAQPPRMSCFMDDGQLSWINNSTSSPIYGGVILAPIGASTDHLPAPSIPTVPELAYGSPRAEMSQAQDGLKSSSSLVGGMTSRLRSFVSTPSVETEDSTPLTKLPLPLARTRQHPLSREISIARSDDSSTVEILRERIKDQRTNIRSKLIESIQSESNETTWSPSEVLSSTNPIESLRSPYIPTEKCQPATPRPLRVQKKESLVRYQLRINLCLEN